MKKEVIGNATLYLANCMEVLPMHQPVDAVITDPPYEAEAHTAMKRTRSSMRTGENDVIDFRPMDEAFRGAVINEIAKKCKGWFLAFCQVEAADKWRQAVLSAEGKYRRTMVWVKPDASPQFNGQGPAQGYECISASWFGDGISKWNAGGKRGVYTHNSTHGRFGGHPTEKPISLMQELVSDFVPVSGVVLDPFMGSGSTGVACMGMGIRFIGIEIDPDYFEIACKRLELAQKQERLFV